MLPVPRPLRRVGAAQDKCSARVKSIYDKRIVLDGTETNLQYFDEYGTLGIKGILTAGSVTETNVGGVCSSSHFSMIEPDAPAVGNNIIFSQPRLSQLIIHSSAWDSLETAKSYLAAQKAAGTPVIIYYQSTTYDGTNGLDVCMTEYQTGFVELDGTESQLMYAATSTNGLVVGPANDTKSGAFMLCSHGVYSSIGTESIRVWRLSSGKVGIYLPESLVTPYGYDGTVTTVKSAAAGYFAAQKAAGTPVQVAYQLVTPETYATDPLDIQKAAGLSISSGAVAAEIKEGQKLVVRSEADRLEIAIYTTENEWVEDVYQQSDFSTARFIYAPPGDSTLKFSHEGSQELNVSVEVRAYYEAV